MQSPSRPSTPRGQGDDHDMSAASSEPSPRISPRGPTSPVRFATSKNAFGLHVSPSSSSSSSTRDDRAHLSAEQSPPLIGNSIKPRLRRPSMLSLAQTASFGSESEGGEEAAGNTGPGPPSAAAGPSGVQHDHNGDGQHHQSSGTLLNPFAPNPLRLPPQWGSSAFSLRSEQNSRSSYPTFEGLSTHTPPIPPTATVGDNLGIEAEMDEQPPKPPLRWMPSHLQTASARRKGKAKMEDQLMMETSNQHEYHKPPFTGRPLPASLVATLMSESAPGDHEIQSEARLQRLISSHPRALPFTPRSSRPSRGRFPETVGDDDEDNDFPNRRAIWAARAWTRRDSSSDSDSDDMPIDDGPPEPVNSAFAAGMDMDRLASMSDGWTSQGESGRVTPSFIPGQGGSGGYPTPPSNGSVWDKTRSARMSFSGSGLVPSPGTGFGLPGAFGSLGMGTGTPLGSPTIEKLELATSPSALSGMSTASPSLMQYRESTGGSASVRPGKRKAQVEDRFDPYKRPRGSSPSFASGSNFPMSPSRATAAIPIPSSPSYGIYSTMLATSISTPSQGGREQINLRIKPNHPYTRPMSSRSRAASPALSIGSTSGSLGTGGNGQGSGRGSFSLGGAFHQTVAGGSALPAPSLGGLGLLSLANRGEGIKEEGEGEGEDMERDDSGMGSSERMEED